MGTPSSLEPQAGSHTVNLYCSQCHSQLGIFENEWTRLTSSYMRPAHQGQHFGTEIAQKTQIVPNGVSQQAVEGCTMAVVFCKKCSAAVGQYCKAAPTAEQKKLVNQYFYKSSKTFLKISGSDCTTEPVFGFGGDLVRGSIRPSIAPRQSFPPLPALPRWSHTPTRTEYTPARSQQPSEPQFRPCEPSLLRNQSYEDSDESVELKIAMQDERIKAQEEKIAGQDLKIQKQDAKIQTLFNQLDGLRRMFESVQTAVYDLQSQGPVNTSAAMTGNEVIRTLESMLRTMKDVHSGSYAEETLRTENQALRAENEALKTKLELLTSTNGTPIPEYPSSNGLGKRKRNSNIARQSHRLSPGSSTGRNRQMGDEMRSSTQVLTPQSSSLSEHSSQASQSGDVCTYSLPGYPDTSASQAIADEAINATAIAFNPQEESSTSEKRQENTITRSTREASLLDVAVNDSIPAVEDDTSNNAIELGYIEFSDDEMGDASNIINNQRLNADEEAATTPIVPLGSGFVGTSIETRPASSSNQSIEGSADEAQNASKRPRTRRSSLRRVTESALEHAARSLAPEPVTRRRTLPRRIEVGGMEHVEVITPALHEQQIREGGRKRQAKTPMQSTEKILHLELMELGLEEWIPCKDKSTNAEYKKAVDAARVRQREKNKLAKLASLGIKLPLPTQQATEAEAPVSLMPGQTAPNHAPAEPIEAVSEATQITPEALSTVVNEQSVRKTRSAGPTQETVQMSTSRKQQRREEIKRRDQLARAALEMDD